MSQTKALTVREVADLLHVGTSTIYALIRRGEIRSYKIGRKIRFTQEDVDAYIAGSRHKHSALLVRSIAPPATLWDREKEEAPELVISGQDVVLDILANYLQQAGIRAARTYLNGFEGLLSLYQNSIHVAACHLYDGSDYNTSFVRSLLPGVPAVLVNISYRIQGFYVQKGNPKNIQGWEDLRRGDISIVNRQVGSAGRILLDTQLKRLDIPASSVNGYANTRKSRLSVAAAVAEGEADLAIGTERISRQMENLDFIPLMEERYDVAIKREMLDTQAVQKLLEILQMPAFRKEIARFSGNDYRDMGKVIAEI